MSPMYVTLKAGVSHLPSRVVTNEINTDMKDELETKKQKQKSTFTSEAVANMKYRRRNTKYMNTQLVAQHEQILLRDKL